MEKRDEERNHIVIPGNIVDENSRKDVKTWLGNEKKADVIFERMLGGHGSLPNEPFFMGKQSDDWYRLLNKEGLFFAETPWAFSRLVSTWANNINTNYKGRLEVAYTSQAVLLKKGKKAPEALPLLDARTVIKLQNFSR